MKSRLFPALACAVMMAGTARSAFVPDFRIKSDDFTILMVPDATVSSGLRFFQAGGHGKFFAQGWHNSDQWASWQVNVPSADDYAVNVLIRRRSDRPLTVTVRSGDGQVAGVLSPAERSWTRVSTGGALHLRQGAATITLKLSDPAGDFDAQVQSIELVRPAVRQALHERALRLRADTDWFQRARYGIMFHWTSQTCPRAGDPKPYARACEDFDVEGLADQMKHTGAGFVLMTTSHAFQYFPAPLKSLDAIIPGRTSQRDLVADLASALEKRDMKLMLYYHIGAADDSAWTRASGFWETDPTRLFANWRNIISEAGQRYGKKLAGWWFDDGSTNYYYRSAPWEQLDRAAKAGFPGRLVGFNPWELPSPTEFHDYFCGEGRLQPSGVDGLLAAGGDGRYPRGTYAGLQASACLITESAWVHSRKDSEIRPPKWNAAQMARILKEFGIYKNVPIFNVEIYQEGKVSPATVEMFRQARLILDAANSGRKTQGEPQSAAFGACGTMIPIR